MGYIYYFTMKPFLLLTMISTSMSPPSDRVKGLLARIPNTCSTRTGDSCVFPFTKVDSQGVHVNGEGNYGFCGADCNIDTVSLAEILESLIGANARTASQKDKDSVVFGNNPSKPSLPK